MSALPVLSQFRFDVLPDFETWRSTAREALQAGLAPDVVNFVDATMPSTRPMFEKPALVKSDNQVVPHVPRAFLETAEIVANHRDPQRWNLMYRLLYRLQHDRNVLRVEVDADVAQFFRMEKQVRHDLHKMHAFVRFRRAVDNLGEHFIAWYKPEHRILKLATPFFAERFAVMRWSILTPDGSVAWNPEEKQLRFGPGVGSEAAPDTDELESLWTTYYSNIFNPARVNERAMRSHMPLKYWGQLPEVAAIPTLLQGAEERVSKMVQIQKTKPSAAPFVPEKHSLTAIREALPSCRGCDLYKCATQAVPGQGRSSARIMLVGEQPGNEEDLQGEPFVGPAGKMLRRILDEIHLDAKEVFVTNAVKHFKFVQRGKLRLHQSPRMSEITACRPWLQAEMDAVKPELVVCLGASAAKSLLGGTFSLMKNRGKIHASPYAERVMATIHPSAILRAPDDEMRHQLYGYLRDDLLVALKSLRKAA